MRKIIVTITVFSFFLFAALLLSCKNEKESAVQEMDRLVWEYQTGGRTAALKQNILDFWAKHDSIYSRNPHYLLAKADAYMAFGEYQTYEKFFAQVPDSILAKRTHLLNRLGDRIHTDKDVALSIMRKMARLGYLNNLEEWVHNSLAQYFKPQRSEKSKFLTNRHFLQELADSSYPDLARITSGLRTWVDAQVAGESPSALAEISTRDFSGEGSRAERYQILIYDLMVKQHGNSKKAADLLAKAINSLHARLSKIKPNSDNRDIAVKRAMLRYQLAHAYYLKASAASVSGDQELATLWLAKAADFSPDIKDRRVKWAYAYEKGMFVGEETYKPVYAEHLKKIGKHREALPVLASLVLENPAHVTELKMLFDEVFADSSFVAYWLKNYEQYLPIAPTFTLQTLQGDSILLHSFRGKWLLLDFWGTWCPPCVEEMPKLEKLWREVKDSGLENADILTIACKDKPEAVANFLQQYKYTFSVVLSDEKVVEMYNVPGYPFKVLVTPGGRYFEIPFTREWLATVRPFFVNSF